MEHLSHSWALEIPVRVVRYHPSTWPVSFRMDMVIMDRTVHGVFMVSFCCDRTGSGPEMSRSVWAETVCLPCVSTRRQTRWRQNPDISRRLYLKHVRNQTISTLKGRWPQASSFPKRCFAPGLRAAVLVGPQGLRGAAGATAPKMSCASPASPATRAEAR